MTKPQATINLDRYLYHRPLTMPRSFPLVFALICLNIPPTFSFDSLRTALTLHQSSRFDKALPIFIALSKNFKAKNDIHNYALCQVMIADMIRTYGGVHISQQLLETNERLLKIKIEAPSLTLSQNYIAQAEAYYANANFKDFKSSILKSIKTKKVLSMPQKAFAEEYLHLARYYLNMPDQQDSCFYWTQKALRLANTDKSFSTYLLARIYNLIGYYFHPKSLGYFIGKEDSAKYLFGVSRKYYDSALLSIQKQALTDELMKAKVYHNLGNSYNNEGKIDKALHYYKLSLAVMEKFGSPSDLVTTDWVIGVAFQRARQPDSAIVQLQKGIARLIPNFKPTSVDAIPPLQTTLHDQWFSSLLILKAGNYFNRYQYTTNIADLLLAYHHYRHSLQFNQYLVSISRNEAETIHWTYLFSSNAYQQVMRIAVQLFKKTHDKSYLENIYTLVASSKYAFLNKSMVNPEATLSNQHSLLATENKIVTENILKNIPSLSMSTLASVLAAVEKPKVISSGPTSNAFSDNLTLSDIKMELARERAALLDFYLSGDELYTLLLTENGLGIHSKIISNEVIQSIKQLRRNQLQMSSQQFAMKSNTIYNLLLDSALSQLPAEINRLIICPDNVLQEVAWEGLATDTINANQFKTIHYLARKYSVRTVLKPSQLLSSNQKMETKYVGVAADFTHSKRFTSIPFSAGLVSAEAKELHGEVLAAFRDDTLNTNIFHIAAHVVIDSIRPYNSAIFLDDDSLVLGNIPTLKINANLVVLNGCQTGNGKYIQSEGTMSVARAFCLLGTNSLISTLWNIDDKASADLLKMFYDKIENGEVLDITLQKAKLDFIDQSPVDELANPYYWSGLQLTGSAQPVFKSYKTKVAWYGSATLLLVMLATLGIWNFKRKKFKTAP